MNPQLVWVFGLSALVVAGAIGWVARAFVRAGGRDRAGQTIWAAIGGVAVLGVYAALGAPGAPDLGLEARLSRLEARVQAQGLEAVSPEEVLAVLARRAKADPAAIEPRLYSGLILAGLNRDEEAARAFESVLRRDGRHVRATLELGRVSARLNGPTNARTLAVFARAAQLAPGDPLPWFYQGLAASEQGRRQDAITFWEGAQARFAPEDPRQQMAAEMLAQARKLPAAPAGQGS